MRRRDYRRNKVRSDCYVHQVGQSSRVRLDEQPYRGQARRYSEHQPRSPVVPEEAHELFVRAMAASATKLASNATQQSQNHIILRFATRECHASGRTDRSAYITLVDLACSDALVIDGGTNDDQSKSVTLTNNDVAQLRKMLLTMAEGGIHRTSSRVGSCVNNGIRPSLVGLVSSFPYATSADCCFHSSCTSFNRS